jgi:PHD/YefM family antitoxin component YafN of YafNO toxin-antitoxin module
MAMKVITVTEAQGRLPEIIYEVLQGEYIVLKDGDREVCLTPRDTHELDVEEDSPELEAELLKAADQPSKPFSFEELRAIGKRLIREHRQK